jgi:hypothetical protein
VEELLQAVIHARRQEDVIRQSVNRHGADPMTDDVC